MPQERVKARPEIPREGELPNTPIVHIDWAEERWVRVGCVRHPDKPYHEQQNAYFVDLDREAINKTISALRRARDAAYGADE